MKKLPKIGKIYKSKYGLKREVEVVSFSEKFNIIQLVTNFDDCHHGVIESRELDTFLSLWEEKEEAVKNKLSKAELKDNLREYLEMGDDFFDNFCGKMLLKSFKDEVKDLLDLLDKEDLENLLAF